MKVLVLSFVLFLITVCCGQSVGNSTIPTLHNGLTEKIGNFSLELLYHTSKAQPKEKNLIISPITVWTILAVVAEGAVGNTLAQINNAIRLTRRTQDTTKMEYIDLAKWLQVKTATIDLAKVNAMFIDQQRLPEQDFRDLAKNFYDTNLVALDFSKAELAADSLNKAIETATRGRIPKLVSPELFSNSIMVLTSALYFKGQWTVPFNSSSTSKMPFYSSDGKKIGEVNMMYNRHTYPFANLKDLQARVIELPYGQENRLSMLVMVPHPGVSLENMFFNFKNVTLDKVFTELRIAREDYGEDEVDCFLPRFKIESTIDMTETLRRQFGITDLFDSEQARLSKIARTPLYVSKMVHKAEIEVTEVGTVATGVTAAEFSNRFGVIRFEANRPFTYMIVERVTNSIVFGGFYQEPSLY
ncbi:serine protease inhibitor 77Ba-like [Ostrinia nubilalis]|uniref:serine protease inhibitor 77Ba-like n=1 Tax=Ostrinia furnacalis TaxID=93504 RepID=UPI00103C5808|nr:serine protease inhibitor 77Ba-like [Ostrinia furnacalis]